MKKPKIKRYRLSVRRAFTEDHPRAGEPTYFVDRILKNGVGFYEFLEWQKIHTIRANYNYWAGIMEKVQRGEAVIELFYWSGSPYNSKRDGNKQIVFATLDKDSGCGVQMLEFKNSIFNCQTVDGDYCYSEIDTIAANDGLSIEDFRAWFEGYDLTKPMAIIHFTKFRY